MLDGHYVLTADNRIGFEVPGYDKSKPLVIDPVLVYSTYLGGTRNVAGNTIAVDSSGSAYVTGETTGTNFPTTPGAFQTTNPNGGSYPTAFVSKLNPSGSALVYSTYLGGSTGLVCGECDSEGSTTYGTGIAVDSSGNAYVTGATYAYDFPTTSGAFQTSCAMESGYCLDAFVTKLNASGSALVYSTYLGGDVALGAAIAVDSTGNAYVTGHSSSWQNAYPFPSTSSLPGVSPAWSDFVTKLNPSGSGLVYSVLIGGSPSINGEGETGVTAIAVDASGDAYVTGQTLFGDYPTTSGAFQTSIKRDTNGNVDAAFLLKLNAAGDALVYGTYLSGSEGGAYGGTSGWGIAVDSSGSAYLTGVTVDPTFPTTPGA